MQGKIFNFIFGNIAPQSNIFVTGIPTLLNYFETFQVCKLENNIFFKLKGKDYLIHNTNLH